MAKRKAAQRNESRRHTNALRRANLKHIKMKGELMMVGPQLAEKWLKTSTGNRSIRKARLALMARDVEHGRWRIHHQGIAIDEKGHLKDGHHRLQFIKETGYELPLFVVTGVPCDGVVYMDSNLPRSASDAIEMADKGHYSNTAVAVANSFTRFPSWATRKEKLSIEEVHARLRRHKAPFTFAVDNTRARGLTRGVKVLIARAWYHVDHARLLEFCAILREGVSDSDRPKDDQAAVAYWKFLQRCVGDCSYARDSERYQKGQTALSAFLERRQMRNIRGSAQDMFPAPKGTAVNGNGESVAG